MQTGPIDSNERLQERLRAIAEGSPELAKTSRLYAAILPVLRDEELPALAALPSSDEVAMRLERGVPFLEGRDLEVDELQATSLLVRLAAAAEEAGATVSAEKMSLWLDEGCGGDVSAAFRSILAGENEPTGRGPERSGMDSALCGILAQAAMKPLLRSWRRQLAPIAAAVKWDKGNCFVCGSEPLFAELQGNDQERHLRCGLCGADWRVSRLSCPHCGNEDHRSLRVFFDESGPASPRIEACDRCMTYMKVIPAFSPTPVDLLPVEDLATRRLDTAARQRGYRRGEDAC